MLFKVKIVYFFILLKLSKWFYSTDFSRLQKRRWNKQVKRLRQSYFYKSNQYSSKKLLDFPIVNKATFMEHFDEINTCGINLKDALNTAINAEYSRDFSPIINGITVGLSTGTSGNKGCFLVSENERALWVACVLDRVIGFSFRKRKVAFFLRANSNLYESVKSRLLEFHYFDILENQDENLKKLKDLQPDIIVAQPSLLLLIASGIEKGNINLSPTQVISIAEVLTPEDKSYLEKIFRQTIHQVYQCTEGLLATTCRFGTLHFNEDFLIIEKHFVNEEQNKFHPIITDLFRISQPIIRYELNDIVTLKNSCACGSKMMAIEQIEGRSDDILLFYDIANNEVKLFPDIFRRTIVLADEIIADYALIQNAPDSLGLYIKSENTNSFANVELAIKQLLLDYNIKNVTIFKITNDPHLVGTKKRRIRNDRRKSD
ncbi:MAG: adenylate synthase [Bacteroidia bacterium]|nr:adenylate synthase [Bacteroidia bacterium]MCF8447441.1 adenylate synthase [Bacteroidia bacterium]